VAFDRKSGNHRFDFDAGVCQRCGMTCEHHEDNGRPVYTGKQPKELERIRVLNE
jgi:hypothetical protein